MADAISAIIDAGFFAALLRIATPLLLATMGELIAERSGVLNLASRARCCSAP